MDNLKIKNRLKNAGFDVDYDNFENEFCYIFISKNGSMFFIKRIKEIIGRTPVFSDINDYNTTSVFAEMKEKYSKTMYLKNKYKLRSVLKNKYGEDYISKFSIFREKGLDLDLKINIFSLTEYELSLIENFKTENVGEKTAIRQFMIMALSGSDYNDAAKINKNNIFRNNTVLFYTKTNGQDVSVPINERFLKFVECDKCSDFIIKNRGNLLRKLKIVAKKSGILSIIQYENGLSIKKSDYISFKIARKTFATLLYNKHIDSNTILSYMGLRKKDSLYDYIVGYKGRKIKNAERKKYFDNLYHDNSNT